MSANLNRRALFALAGAVLFTTATAARAEECAVCGKEIGPANATFKVEYADGKQETYGCPHCGFTAMQGREVKSATTTDFLRRTTIDARTAWYLRGSEVGYCCEPSWLSFATQEEAEKFARGFGGEVLDYDAASKSAAGQLHHVED